MTRKISTSVARIKLGLAKEVRLGDLDAVRDWGHARDYVRAMHQILQLDQPDEFVIATGRAHSVRDLCEIAFAAADLDYRDWVVVDERLVRPAETLPLLGDASKAHRVLGWQPTVGFEELVREMVECDLAELQASQGRGAAVT